jgi:hypothetical protein
MKMELRKVDNKIIVYTGMNVPEFWDEDWDYISEAEFEEQEDGSWKKTEYEVEVRK